MSDKFKGADGNYDVAHVISNLNNKDRYGNDPHLRWTALIENAANKTNDPEAFKNAILSVNTPEEVKAVEKEFGVKITGVKSAKEFIDSLNKARQGSGYVAEPSEQPSNYKDTREFVDNTYKAVANAKPGQWVKNSRGEVQLTQGDINWAREKLGLKSSSVTNKSSETPDAMAGHYTREPKEVSSETPDAMAGDPRFSPKTKTIQEQINKAVNNRVPDSAAIAMQKGKDRAAYVAEGGLQRSLDEPNTAKQIPYTVKAVASSAKPGDYIIQPDDTKIIISQEMINKAKSRLNQSM